MRLKGYVRSRAVIFNKQKTKGGLEKRLFETKQGLYYRQRRGHAKMVEAENKVFEDLADAPGARNNKQIQTNIESAKGLWDDLRRNGGVNLRKALLKESNIKSHKDVYDAEMNILLDGDYKGKNAVLSALARAIKSMKDEYGTLLKEMDEYADTGFIKHMPVVPNKNKLVGLGEDEFVKLMKKEKWADQMYRSEAMRVEKHRLEELLAKDKATKTTPDLDYDDFTKLEAHRSRLQSQIENIQRGGVESIFEAAMPKYSRYMSMQNFAGIRKATTPGTGRTGIQEGWGAGKDSAPARFEGVRVGKADQKGNPETRLHRQRVLEAQEERLTPEQIARRDKLISTVNKMSGYEQDLVEGLRKVKGFDERSLMKKYGLNQYTIQKDKAALATKLSEEMRPTGIGTLSNTDRIRIKSLQDRIAQADTQLKTTGDTGLSEMSIKAIERRIAENDPATDAFLRKMYKELTEDPAVRPTYRSIDSQDASYWFNLNRNTPQGQDAYKQFTRHFSKENASPIMEWRQSALKQLQDASTREVIGSDMHKAMDGVHKEFVKANTYLKGKGFTTTELDKIKVDNEDHLKIIANPLDAQASQWTQISKRVISAGLTGKSGFRQLTSDSVGHSLAGAWAQGRGLQAPLEVLGNVQRLFRLATPKRFAKAKQELAAVGQEVEMNAVAKRMGHVEMFEEAGEVLTGRKDFIGKTTDFFDRASRKYADWTNLTKGDDFLYTGQSIVARHITGRNLMEIVTDGWESAAPVYRQQLEDLGLTKQAIGALKGAQMRKSDMLNTNSFWNKFSGRTDNYMIKSFKAKDLPNLETSGFMRGGETAEGAAKRLQGLHDHFLEHASDRYLMRSTPLDQVGAAPEKHGLAHFVKAHTMQFWTPALTQAKHQWENLQRVLGVEAGAGALDTITSRSLYSTKNAGAVMYYMAHMGATGMAQQWIYDILTGRQPRDITVANVINGMVGAGVGGKAGFLLSGSSILYDLAFFDSLGGGDTTSFYADLVKHTSKGEWGKALQRAGGGLLNLWWVNMIIPNQLKDAVGIGPKEANQWRERYMGDITGLGEGFKEGTPEEAKTIVPRLFPDLQDAIDGEGFNFWRKSAAKKYWQKQERKKRARRKRQEALNATG